MSPSQCPLTLECFRVDEVIDISTGVIAFLLQQGVFAVVRLEESKGAPLATSLTHLIDGTFNLVVTASLEALAAPPVCLTSTWPKAVFRPMVGGSASPAVMILLWTVEGEVVV